MDKKQTPTEIKAQAKAKELVLKYNRLVYPYFGSSMLTNETDEGVILHNSKECSLILCDQMIETLSSMKGMARISKNTFWKRVKEILEDGDNKEV
ncbi:hypothetical protein M1M25_gp116 [Tenacibaculum phage Gundel_1]|uniref:Uncharacterized protein n=1 Tax=Tenacibaculum phage Gundel_1 TaxID=2745672 RepID=A0A8E4ZGF5_9CAUD|nr:hypothetical protein M1M25_gp116 [Tenacibaculum phage Gundel_1]QQV91424.1 hypothetical protein Gundel1_102 [Tenacibaculum phage Gundel_1]